MQAHPTVPSCQSTRRSKIPIRVHLRSSGANPLAFGILSPSPPARQAPPNTQPRSSTAPPRPSASPRKTAAATRTPRAPDDRRAAGPSSPPSPAPRGGPTRLSPIPPRPSRQTASARRNPYTQRNHPRTQPPSPPWQLVPSANPHLSAATPYAQRNRRRTRQANPPSPPIRIRPPQRHAPRETAPCPQPHLRALRARCGGSSFLPTRLDPTRPSPHPAMLLRTIPPCTSPQTGPYLASSLP
jgi:hypothetical protein